MGRERSLKSWVVWDSASGDERSGSLRLICSSMPVMKSIRWKGVEKSTSVGLRVLFFALNSRMCSAMPERRVSVVDMRSSRLA